MATPLSAPISFRSTASADCPTPLPRSPAGVSTCTSSAASQSSFQNSAAAKNGVILEGDTTATIRKPGRQSKRDKIVCGLCLSPVVEGKEDLLQCAGSCKLWFHRCCAGVYHSFYKAHLSTECHDTSPFTCLHCSEEACRAVVAQLQAELAALMDQVTALKVSCHN